MVISPYVTHRHPAFWPDPEKFDPDRFLPDNVAKRLPHAFFPWGMGEHECTGRDFQLLETSLVLAMILQKYRLQTVPGQVVKAEGRITVRPANRVLMKTVQNA